MKIIIVILLFITTLSADKTLEKVSLQLKWKYQFQFAGFIAAKEKGFYKEAGLDVDLIEFDESQKMIQDVNDGTIEFSISDSALILEAMKGEPVVAMMAVFQNSPYILMGLKSSGIKVMDDLNGKKIGLYDNINGITIKAMLESRRVQYIKKPVLYTLDKLINKEVDMMTTYISNEPYAAQEMGLDIVTFNPKAYGFDNYGDILFTSKSLLQKRPDLVAKMYDASRQGWEYAFSHIDEIVELIYKKYNTLNKTKEALLYEANILKNLSGYGKNFGELKAEKVQSISQIFSLMIEGTYDLDNLNNFIYQKDSSETELTQEELAYLKSKKIRVCVHPDLYPYEFIRDAQHKGVTAEYLRLLTKDYPFNFELIRAENDKEVFQNVYASKCDLKPTVIQHYNILSEYMDETTAYDNEPLVLITDHKKAFVDNIAILKDKKIAVRYQAIKDFLSHNYPSLNVTVVHDMQTMMQKLERGAVFGFIEPSHSAKTVIQRYGFDLLKVNMKLHQPLKAVMGISKKEPQLLTIINKLIKKAPENEIENIQTRWTIQTYYQITDYALIWKIIMGSVLILSIILYWTIKYNREIKRRKAAEKSLREINLSLEERVETEVEKNRQQQLVMLQQSRYAQMGEMISMIAHQWRQPLNSLSMIVQSIALKYKMGKMDSTLMDKLSLDSKKQIDQMSQTIDDFRDFFKPDREVENFGIHEPIYHTAELMKPILEHQGILLRLDLGENISIKGFPHELGQVLVSILNNAKDVLADSSAVKEKTVEISLKVDSGNIVILVSDNGGGIPPEIIDTIFDPYFTTKQEKNGTGLGLYMSKTIIEEHCGGKLSVANSSHGAVFKIVLKGKL